MAILQSHVKFHVATQGESYGVINVHPPPSITTKDGLGRQTYLMQQGGQARLHKGVTGVWEVESWKHWKATVVHNVVIPTKPVKLFAIIILPNNRCNWISVRREGRLRHAPACERLSWNGRQESGQTGAGRVKMGFHGKRGKTSRPPHPKKWI